MSWDSKPGDKKRWRRSGWNQWDEVRKTMYFCGGKISYGSREEAETAELLQREKGYNEMRVYYHIDCAAFHLTSRLERM